MNNMQMANRIQWFYEMARAYRQDTFDFSGLIGTCMVCGRRTRIAKVGKRKYICLGCFELATGYRFEEAFIASAMID
jgi:hypothetical protein